MASFFKETEEAKLLRGEEEEEEMTEMTVAPIGKTRTTTERIMIENSTTEEIIGDLLEMTMVASIHVGRHTTIRVNHLSTVEIATRRLKRSWSDIMI